MAFTVDHVAFVIVPAAVAMAVQLESMEAEDELLRCSHRWKENESEPSVSLPHEIVSPGADAENGTALDVDVVDAEQNGESDELLFMAEGVPPVETPLAQAPMPGFTEAEDEVPEFDKIEHFDGTSGVLPDLLSHLTAAHLVAARSDTVNLYNALIIRVFVLYGFRIVFSQRCSRNMTVGDLLILMGKNPHQCVLQRNDRCLTLRERVGDWGERIVAFDLVYRRFCCGKLRGMDIPSLCK